MNSEKSSKKNKKKRKLFYNFCYDFVKVTGAIPTLLMLRPKVYYPYGKNTVKGAVLIVANHRSLWDPVTLFFAFPTRRLHCLATANLFDKKIKAAFFSQMHCIMVDKDNFALTAFREVVSRLNDGHAVLVFPEGQLNRSQDNSLLAFKSGTALMASRANAPILPIYIVKRDKWYNRHRVVVGKPMYVEHDEGKMPSVEQLNAVSEDLRITEIKLREYFESLPIGKRLMRKSKQNSSQ